MDSAKRKTRATVELNGVLSEGGVRMRLFEDDKDADVLEVHVLIDGKAADLNGMVAGGEMRRADGTRVECKAKVSGGVVLVELNEHCYLIPGEMTISVHIGNGTSNSVTLLVIHGEVIERGDGAMVDIDETLVNVEDIFELYAGMSAALEETREAINVAREAGNAVGQMTIEVTTVGSDESASVEKETNKNGGIHLEFSIPKGERGTVIYNGDKITGMSTTPAAFATGIVKAVEGDLYANTGIEGDAGNVYVCVKGGNDQEATWAYRTNWRGAAGAVEGIDYYDGEPMPLGEPSPGTAQGLTARGDHVHPMPTAEDVGAASKANLLRNSNFKKPVNQRKLTSYTGAGYTIDCWKLSNSTTQITVHDGFINIKALNGGIGYFRQQFINPITDGVYTLAICVRGSGQGRAYFTTDNGSSGAGSITFTASNEWQIYCGTIDAATASSAPNQFTIRSDDEEGFDILWAAMYEGAFTAETLPLFDPKDFAPVLVDCKLDYQNSWYGTGQDVEQIYTGVIFNSSTMDVRIPVSHMRALPTVNFLPKEDGTPSWRVYNQGSYRAIQSINISRPSADVLMVRIKKGSADESTWTPNSAATVVGNWEASCES